MQEEPGEVRFGSSFVLYWYCVESHDETKIADSHFSFRFVFLLSVQFTLLLTCQHFPTALSGLPLLITHSVLLRMTSTVTSNASVLLLLLLKLFLREARAEWVETAKLVDMDGESQDYFGWSVAVDNGTVVVGSRRDNITGVVSAGSVSIFEQSRGEWLVSQKLTASDAEANDLFGSAVAIGNGMLVVGMPRDDDGGGNAGAVYIYGMGADRSWTEQQKLVPSSTNGYFGYSLAMQETAMVVGAYVDSSSRGAAYVYTLSRGTWTETAKLRAADGVDRDEFGKAVAIDGETIVIGARGDDDLASFSGSAYVFQQEDEGGAWRQVAKLTPTDGQFGDEFGRAVAIGGKTIFVGSKNKIDGFRRGAVFQFGEEDGGTWRQQDKLIPTDFEVNQEFGRSLLFQDDTLVVGAHSASNYAGAVYIMNYAEESWTERAKLVAGDARPSGYFGWDVAFKDGTVVAGACLDISRQGSAYVVEWLSSESPSITPTHSSASPTCKSREEPNLIKLSVMLTYMLKPTLALFLQH